jgi:predicted lipid-binding transport protein (Tim44 family)
MKKLITIFTMLFMFTMVSPYVEAKKFGGGKSFGRQHSTTTAKKQSTHQHSNTSNTNNKQNQTSDKPKSKGFMGGMLGGLLAGGLLGSMLGGGLGGLGGGGGFMGILLLALLAFAIFKVIKLMKGMNIKPTASNEEYATNTYQQPINNEQPTNEQFREQYDAIDHSTTNKQDAVSTETLINLPPNFDTKSCITEACSHYRTIQQAWDTNNFSKIKEYVAPELIEELKTERSHLSQTQQTVVLYIDAEIVRADYNEDLAQLSIKFFGKYKEDDNIEKDIDDTWHLERNLKASNSSWLITGIE